MSARWLLPHGVEDVLPPQAEVLYSHSRDLLQLCSRWGYQQIATPLFEFTESLLVDNTGELDLRTGKLVDQSTGRMLGVRSDFSAQAARIYARNFYPAAPVRLCYFGELLCARGGEENRIPLRVGAELFGSSSLSASVEVMQLLSICLQLSAVDSICWVVGHGGVFHHLARDLPADRRSEVQRALQRKDAAEMKKLGAGAKLLQLCDMYGDASEIKNLAAHFADDEYCQKALLQVETLIDALQAQGEQVSYDFGEVHGCSYHTGVVFAAFAAGHGQVLARGGRYDELASQYGYSVAATGFDLDLRALLNTLAERMSPPLSIYAPAQVEMPQIEQLREQGHRVVRALDDDQGAQACGCTHVLQRDAESTWSIVELNS